MSLFLGPVSTDDGLDVVQKLHACLRVCHAIRTPFPWDMAASVTISVEEDLSPFIECNHSRDLL